MGRYKAVLVIPDIYNRLHLKELTSLLLTRIGFGHCFLVQDHVAAGKWSKVKRTIF
jgi:actin-related protein 8